MRVSTPQRGKPVLLSVFTTDSTARGDLYDEGKSCFVFWFPIPSLSAKGRQLWDRNPKQDFSTPSQAFSPGTIKKIPCCIIELWVRFREESSAFGRFCRLEFQRMANWPSFCPESSRIGRFCRLDFQRMTNWSSFCTVLKIWASWPSVGIRACKIGQSHHTLSKIDH